MYADNPGEQYRPNTDTVAYKPSESAIAGARADVVHADRVVLEVSLPACHQRIRERVEAIVMAAADNEVLQQIVVTAIESEYQSGAIDVDPLENWFEEGQLGMTSAHVVLRPAGGLHTAVVRSRFTAERSYRSFSELTRAIARMN